MVCVREKRERERGHLTVEFAYCRGNSAISQVSIIRTKQTLVEVCHYKRAPLYVICIKSHKCIYCPFFLDRPPILPPFIDPADFTAASIGKKRQ